MRAPSYKNPRGSIWEFPKTGVPYLGVLIIRILLFRVLHSCPLFSETPIYAAILEVGPQNHSRDGLLEPGSIMVVYMDLLGP